MQDRTLSGGLKKVLTIIPPLHEIPVPPLSLGGGGVPSLLTPALS